MRSCRLVLWIGISLATPSIGFAQGKAPADAFDPELKAAIKNAPTAAQFPNSDFARILDLANVTVKPDGTVVGVYRDTFKILNERGRRAAEVSLPYNSTYQSMTVLKARTIKKDGRILDVKPADIRTSSSFSDYPMYDDSQTVGFSMPGVEDECIIDYSWKVVTKPLLMPGQFWEDWYFTGAEPVSISRYSLSAPADKQIHWKVHNDESVKPAVVTSPDGKTKTYTWTIRAAKPIDIEPAMPDQRELRTWMELTTLDNWQQIAAWYWSLAKNQATPNESIKKTVATLIADKTDEVAKAQAIYDWVANRVRYVGLEFGLSAFKPHAAPDVSEKLYGDCKDKATLLITMLKLAGIKAHPVLLQAEEKGADNVELPGLDAFNHCIALAEVNSQQVWLDATAETCVYGDIPDGDRGVRAFVIRDGQGKFETIPNYQPEENGFESNTHVALQPDGSASVKIETRMKGATAQQWRTFVRSINPEQRKQAVQTMAQSFAIGGTLRDYKIPDAFEKKDPYTLSLDLAAPSRARKIGSLLIVPIANGTGSDRTNPFVKEKRVWPIAIEEATLQKGETTITVPEGYVIEEVPDDTDLVAALFEYHAHYTRSPDGKSVKVETRSITRPGRVPPEEYSKVKAHYDNVLRAREDAIVLRRVKTTTER